MNAQQNFSPTPQVVLLLEVAAEDEQQINIADVDEVGRSIFDYLRENGCTVKPHYTGSMGSPIVEIIPQTVQTITQTYQVIHSNQDLLAAFFAFIAATLEILRKYQERREKEKERIVSGDVILTIPTTDKNSPLIIEAPDAETAIKMFEQLKITHHDKITPHSTRMKLNVSRRKRRQLH